MFVTRNVWMKYRSPTDGDGSDLGGGAGSEDNKGSQDGASGAGAGEGKGGNDEGGKGENKPSDAEAKLIKEVMEKKTKLKAEQDARAALEAKLKQFEGIDPEAVRKILSEKQAEETRKLEEKGQWDSLKKQMAEEHTKEKSALEQAALEKTARVSALEAQIAELTVGNAFASSSFIKDDMTMPVGKARVLYATHFEFKDGAVVGYDKPAGSAERNVLVDSKGEPLSFESAIKKIVEADPDRDSLLKSKVKPGAGSSTTKKATTPDSRMEQVSGKDRIAAALSKGLLGKK